MAEIDICIPKRDSYLYPVIIGSGIMEKAEEYVKKYSKAEKFLVVTNETVYPLFKDKFKLSNAKFVILPDGEEYKTMESVNKIIDKAIEYKLDRYSAIVALGGGVIGDMAGFAAAIFQRGIDFIQIPTTLLAQVDSSVGGKVAVNHHEGKNLIGNFYQPKLVLSDMDALRTLDLRQFKTGLAEVIKYSYIENSCGDSEKFNFFDFLKENREKIYQKDPETLAKMIEICCKLKSCVVNQDEKEKGLRAILNFGHTFAHAIEQVTEYKMFTHGEAVSIGMFWAFKFAYYSGLINENYAQKCVDLLKEYELKFLPELKLSGEALCESMNMDKKIQNGVLRFVMPEDDFKVKIIKDVSKETLLQFFKTV